MATRLEVFENAIRETNASVTVATPETIDEILSKVITLPAVGAPLPFDDVSLERVSPSIDTRPTRIQLLEAETGVTGATLGIASYGSVVLRATGDVDELAALFPERHVVLVRECDVVDDMVTAFDELAPIVESDGADVIVATGPSATADMGALVHGVHGPTEVHVVIVATDDGGIEEDATDDPEGRH
ncbi:lactate utilization protein C [Natrarchaeobius halalkaliphilus]|uniref:Lactate utilization protein C n=1 Tax=Natrarchaeobius halalkaliphilus TaxID=1679091 RepID=A0A3N6LRQ4_9EURY|nr:LUD domain-containing protein [Natrarchaeobius halalkaliphilus]RQG91117.1 lactate utilization protein C [Natrarchaeobius halalkaliphilus]